MDFTSILQTPEVRAIVQDFSLERAFHDALFPGMMFRSEAVPVLWPDHAGDNQVFSAPGLIAPKQRSLQPGVDPSASTYSVEQWMAQKQIKGDSIDTHMPTSLSAIIDLFMRNAHQLGMSAAQALNRIVRNRMYNAAESGWTVANGAQSGTSLKVKRLNGFTRARRPDVSGASVVRFEQVSSSNPLPITVLDNSVATAFNVIGYTPDTAGDELGPGTLLLDAATTSVLDRAYVQAYDRSNLTFVGGGNKVDDVGTTDLLNLASMRTAVAKLWQNSVPAHSDGRFHGHLDPMATSQPYKDDEFGRLNTSLPDYVIYREFALGEILNIVWLRNNECPIASTVQPYDGTTFSQDDDFAPELYNNGDASTGVALHRALITAQGGIFEYYEQFMGLITDAGVMGKVAEPRIVNNGIEVNAERIMLIIRGPQNKFQDMVSTSWKFTGDWPARTDAATGDKARYKRFHTIISGE